ncbi:hypothetical protein LXL04_035289 [Taraxacum kok-saghyz]
MCTNQVHGSTKPNMVAVSCSRSTDNPTNPPKCNVFRSTGNPTNPALSHPVAHAPPMPSTLCGIELVISDMLYFNGDGRSEVPYAVFFLAKTNPRTSSIEGDKLMDAAPRQIERV